MARIVNMATLVISLPHLLKMHHPVALSIFSGIFNVGIGGGTWIGGQVTAHGLLPYIGYAGAAIGLVAAVYCFTAYFHFLGRAGESHQKNS